MGPPLDAEQEVRFAVVLYGGVSLAVYINGVVQELLRLVRATAPAVPITAEGPGPHPTWFGNAELTATERIYREVGQMLPATTGFVHEDAPIRTRFVVDILSGTSAGGINAIFLAKAIANQQDIEALRNLWISEADVADLLNDGRSYKGLDGVERDPLPGSLLNGDRLFVRALKALREMKDPAEAPDEPYKPAYADELDLAVTTTDLQGLALRMELADGEAVWEKRHRNVLRFKYAGPEATGEQSNDFLKGNDTLLAFAARSTSAFPFAFEPAVASDLPLRLNDSADWAAFYPDYVDREAPFAEYAFADGGYLDNKPFTYATEALRRRRADVPVIRKLVYVEPDPTGDPLEPGGPAPPVAAHDAPDAFENVLASFLLPRHETIRDDIEAVLERNRAVERIRHVCLSLRDAVLSGTRDPLDGLHDLEPTAGDIKVFEAIPYANLAYRSYLQLRFATHLDDLAVMLVQLGGGREDPYDVATMRTLAQRALTTAGITGDGPGTHRRAFLQQYDVRFRIRRLAFVQDRINELLKDRANVDDTRRGALIRVKRHLNADLIALRTARRMTQRISDPSQNDLSAGGAARLGEMRAHAKTLLEIATGDTAAAVAADPGAPPPLEFVQELNAVLSRVAEHLAGPLHHADDAVLGELSTMAPRGTRLDEYYRRYESFDMVSLPLTYPGLESVNPVDVVRIAPEDATNIVSEGDSDTPAKLAGIRLGHFGGFLDADWRRNDLLWGRLDGAERILTTLLPGSEHNDARNDLINRAQGAILREELVEKDRKALTDRLVGAVAVSDEVARDVLERFKADASAAAREVVLAALGTATDLQLVEAFRRSHDDPPPLDTERMAAVAGRAAQITGKILDRGAKEHGYEKRPGFWLTRIGRLVSGVVEVALPAGGPLRWTTLLFRHWASVALLLAAVLILAGILGVEAAQKAGWLLAGATLLALAAVWVAGAAVSRIGVRAKDRPRHPMRRRLLQGIVLVGLILGIAAQGVDWLVIAAAILAGFGLVGLVILWAFSAPDRRRLMMALAGLLVLVLALAAVEVARHGSDDVSSLAAKLPGERDAGIEQTVRDQWAQLWPWSDAGPPVPDGVVALAGERGDAVIVDIPPGDGEISALRRKVEALRDAKRDRRQQRLGDLLASVLAGATRANVAALADFLQTTDGLSEQAAELALGVLARSAPVR